MLNVTSDIGRHMTKNKISSISDQAGEYAVAMLKKYPNMNQSVMIRDAYVAGWRAAMEFLEEQLGDDEHEQD